MGSDLDEQFQAYGGWLEDHLDTTLSPRRSELSAGARSPVHGIVTEPALNDPRTEARPPEHSPGFGTRRVSPKWLLGVAAFVVAAIVTVPLLTDRTEGAATLAVTIQTQLEEDDFVILDDSAVRPLQSADPVRAVSSYLRRVMPAGEADSLALELSGSTDVSPATVVVSLNGSVVATAEVSIDSEGGGWTTRRVHSRVHRTEIGAVSQGLRGLVSVEEPGSVAVAIYSFDVELVADKSIEFPADRTAEAILVEFPFAAERLISRFYNEEGEVTGIEAYEVGFQSDADSNVSAAFVVTSTFRAQARIEQLFKSRLDVFDVMALDRWMTLALLNPGWDPTESPSPDQVVATLVLPTLPHQGTPYSFWQELAGDDVIDILPLTDYWTSPFGLSPGEVSPEVLVVTELPRAAICRGLPGIPVSFRQQKTPDSRAHASADEAIQWFLNNDQLARRVVFDVHTEFVDPAGDVVGYGFSQTDRPYLFVLVAGVSNTNGAWTVDSAESVGC